MKRSKGMRDLGQDRSFHLCPALVQIPSPINWGATSGPLPPRISISIQALQSRIRRGEGVKKTYKIFWGGFSLEVFFTGNPEISSDLERSLLPQFSTFSGPSPQGCLGRKCVSNILPRCMATVTTTPDHFHPQQEGEMKVIDGRYFLCESRGPS